MKVSYSCLFLLALLFAACEKSTDWALETTDTPRLVVEAILTDKNETQEILLSQTFSELNGEPPAVGDAEIYVEVSEVIYNFAPDPSTPGRYLSATPFAVIGGLDYTLHVEWAGETYTAVSRLSEVAPIPAPTFEPVSEDGDSLKLGSFIPAFSTDEQALYRIDIDWSHLVDTVALPRARLYRYTFRSLDMSQLVPPPQEDVFFPPGSLVYIEKFGLNDHFAEYLRAKAIETDWSGAFFFSVSDNLPTNISNGGLGFFSTCAVVRGSWVAE